MTERKVPFPHGRCRLVTAVLLFLGCVALPVRAAAVPPPWRVIIANDTCPDTTWGFTETQTHQVFADLIAAHLDEMNRTDTAPPENRDHYNATAFIEVQAFLEKSPTTHAQRLLHFFPVHDGARHLHIETTAAVLRPRPQPDGDLLPGADTRRFAAQGFVDAAAGRLPKPWLDRAHLGVDPARALVTCL